MIPDAEQELAELRRRAYGPAGGHALASEDVARLEELEQRMRAQRAAARRVGDGADASPEAAPAASAAPPFEESAASDASLGATAQNPVHARAWWARPSTWIAAGLGVVVGVLATIAAIGLTRTPPDATLHALAAGSYDAADEDVLEYLGVGLSDVVRYEKWHELDVWTATRADGAVCIIASVGEAYWDARCTGADLDPQLDVWVYSGMDTLLGADLPADSSIRVTAHGGVVELWARAAGGVSAS